ncbi:MAG TPA: lytic transglycosylase domain-containing protein [Micropepsaceae bacterium]|nr:lytic transglycosylase domain-containing protein [Micropepsaceae bacterium]
MEMHANTATAAPAGSSFFPVSVLISLIVLLAMLFAVLQSANLPLTSDSYTKTIAKAPFFRGLVYLPQFRFLPLFQGANPAAKDENGVPPDDLVNRWDPYIKEASARFAIPEKWIRTIISIESGGHTMWSGKPITSNAGAMGVMQLEPDTFKEVSARHGLGSNPYNVHDNILAGTAYLRELYNKYGYPRLFAAYNAGPGTLEQHIARGIRLPAETVNYIRKAVLGTGTPAAAKKAVAEAMYQKPTSKHPVKVAASHAVKLAAAKPAAGRSAKHVAARQVHVAAKPVHMARAAHHSGAHAKRRA